MIIHQLVHTLSYGDAISGEVLAIKRFFKEQGLESEVYALNVHPLLKGEAQNIEDLPADLSCTLILHYSLGSPLNSIYLNANKCQRSLIYHNLTPAHWFKGVNPRISRDIDQGLEELPELCKVSDLILADSEFNALELKTYGFRSEVLGLPIDENKWSQPRNEGIYNLVKQTPGIHLLHVGRLAPNKCIQDIIKTFYFLHHSIEKQSTLWLVGIDIDTELYSFELKSLVEQLHLRDAVRFVGCMADSEVKALYEAGSVYICMSEHEGFCLPLIEAMHFSMPVIAYAQGAVPATLGRGGVLVKEKRHAEMAELIAELANPSSELRKKTILEGRKRVEELSHAKFKENLKKLFLPKQLYAGQQLH
jgi:glycosyltransferase involved in cell wall biosynthesis